LSGFIASDMSFSRLFSKKKKDSNSQDSDASQTQSRSLYQSSNQQSRIYQPPPYSPVAPTTGGSASAYYDAPEDSSHANPSNLVDTTSSASKPVQDDAYAFLRQFDTVCLIDDSGSMSGSRWKETAAALAAIIPITTYYDKDGVDLYFLNHRDHPSHMNITSPDQVMRIFNQVSPQGATPTGQKLKGILKPYLDRYEKQRNTTKPLNIIVITDGVPTDDVESVIVQAAKRLDKLDADLSQVGIQFFQVGNDVGATEALSELDDVLKSEYNVRDMVDTVPWMGSLQGDQMLKVVLGAVNRRLDRKPAR